MPAKGQTVIHSDETRKKISDAVRQAYASGKLVHWSKKYPDHPFMRGFQGKHTAETKAKISKSKKGQGLGNKYRLGITPWNKGKKHPVHNAEWKRKVSESNSGENHWNWQGGINAENRLMRSSAKHKDWSLAVLRRDKWTCQKCGYKGRQLIAHHVKSFSKHPDLRFEVSNGITFCRACHCAHHKPRTGTGKSPTRQSV